MDRKVGSAVRTKTRGDDLMQVEQLRKVHRAAPFRPFIVHLADGRAIQVNHPEFMMTSPTGRTFVIYGTDDAFEVIDLLLVTSIEVLDGKE